MAASSKSIFRWSLSPRTRCLLDLKIQKEPVEKFYDIHWNNVVGEGVSGAVCECESIETGQKFVLKTLPKNDYALQEIQLHFMCTNSKNVVQIEAVYECYMRASSLLPEAVYECYMRASSLPTHRRFSVTPLSWSTWREEISTISSRRKVTLPNQKLLT